MLKPFETTKLAAVHDQHIAEVRTAVRTLKEKGYLAQTVAEVLKVPLNTAKTWMRGTTVPSGVRNREAFLKFAREAPVFVPPKKLPNTVIIWPNGAAQPAVEIVQTSTEAIAKIRGKGLVPKDILDANDVKDYGNMLQIPPGVTRILLAKSRK